MVLIDCSVNLPIVRHVRSKSRANGLFRPKIYETHQ